MAGRGRIDGLPAAGSALASNSSVETNMLVLVLNGITRPFYHGEHRGEDQEIEGKVLHPVSASPWPGFSAGGSLCVLCVSVVQIRLRAKHATIFERSLEKRPRCYPSESRAAATILIVAQGAAVAQPPLLRLRLSRWATIDQFRSWLRRSFATEITEGKERPQSGGAGVLVRWYSL